MTDMIFFPYQFGQFCLFILHVILVTLDLGLCLETDLVYVVLSGSLHLLVVGSVLNDIFDVVLLDLF